MIWIEFQNIPRKGYTMAEDTKVVPSAPYVSFRTLLNLLDKLDPEPPTRIDKSVLSYLSGGYASQVLAALRWLGLINAAGEPSAVLVELVTIPAARKDNVRGLWHTAYAEIFSKRLEKATAGQLEEAFKDEYALEGKTREKAVTFFVHGAQFAEIPLSALILKRVKRTTAPGRKPKKSRPALEPEPVTRSFNPSNGMNLIIHPMLIGAIQWLSENADGWADSQCRVWCDNFVSSVRLVYPPGRATEKAAID